MKKRIKLGLLSVAMGIVAVNGVSSSDNSNKSMAKADTIIEEEEFDYSNVVAPQAMILPARIKSIDATYTGKENIGTETRFNTHDYFANLMDNSPYNSVGSCGFVSLSQLLCYYDTFYNDDIVPEQYEVKNLNAKTENEANKVSPGVLRQIYRSSSQYPTYYDFCHAYEDKDLQCKLTIIYNEIKGTDDKEHFSGGIGAWSYQQVLDRFYGEGIVNVSLVNHPTQEYAVQYIKNSIDNNTPVIVHVTSANEDWGGHSIVSYDYDATKIYTHYGWSSGSSTYDVYQNYPKIYYLAKLDFTSMGHKCSDNYIINGKGYCGCNVTGEFHATTTFDNKKIVYWGNDGVSTGGTFSLNSKIFLGRTLKTDLEFKKDVLENIELMAPNADVVAYDKIFADGLNKEEEIKEFEIEDENLIREYLIKENIQFDGVNLSSLPIFRRTIYIFKSTSNAIEIPPVIFNEIFGGISTVNATLKLKNENNYDAKSRTLKKSEFDTMTSTIHSTDYGFGNVYAQNVSTKVIKADGLEVTTRRLRAGSIYDSSITHNTYTTLSSKKTGYGVAYIEYTLPVFVKSVDIDLAFWSTSEGLNKSTGTAEIDFQDDDGSWIVGMDLLTETTLSTDKDNMSKVNVTFWTETNTFRIYTSVKNATSSSNKARLCVGDITMYF